MAITPAEPQAQVTYAVRYHHPVAAVIKGPCHCDVVLFMMVAFWPSEQPLTDVPWEQQYLIATAARPT